ncbi:thioredoxin [Clavibacter sepedonicus]|uniref:thioredoxin n=1 Tax=Clavibacter sepedonicus TaxID=31964 RepID=UPI00031DF0A2|nr:thioredoxin [Clavibacter sepedonicus]UUK66892.1 thioredoxin [Clavibacter sepedonicus]
MQRLLPWLPVEELDVATHPDRAEAEGIRSTPTILVRAGHFEVLPAEGVPTAPQVLQAVVRAMDGTPPSGPAGAPGREDPA